MLKIVGITQEGQLEKDIHIEKFQPSNYIWFWADFNNHLKGRLGIYRTRSISIL